ncbi:MAG: hypothetical protein K6A65_08250 [Succinivibrionaceae bacterium]|nr:hypothetical protein [Succinivibrionaceae bacterium]
MKTLRLATLAAALSLAAPTALAIVRVDITNNMEESCSVAIHARTGRTTWLTVGWYVFAPHETAPVLLSEVDDVRNIYVYNDCGAVMPNPSGDTKRVWVRENVRFSDELAHPHEAGYSEVVFERLGRNRYSLNSPQVTDPLLQDLPQTAPRINPVRVDIKNDTGEDCSLAVAARGPKGTFVVNGWYVFGSGEEAPVVIEEEARDVRDLYLYSDCGPALPDGSETVTLRIRLNNQFREEASPNDPRKPAPGDGYVEVPFQRLSSKSVSLRN